MTTVSERRKYRRYELALDVQVKPRKRSAGVLETHTRDISARGIYFELKSKMEVGSELQFELNLPPELSAGKDVHIRCRGRILRLDPLQDPAGHVGVVASIDNYEFVRPEEKQLM